MVWHLKGAALDLDTYLGYSQRRRALIRVSLNKLIQEHNAGLEEED